MGCCGKGLKRYSLNPFVGHCLVRFFNIFLICVAFGTLLLSAIIVYLEPKIIADILRYDLNTTDFLGGTLIGKEEWTPQPECESVQGEEMVKQPINTLSSLVYILIGIYIWMLFVRDMGIETEKQQRKSRSSQMMDRLVPNGPADVEILPGYNVSERPPSLLLKQPLWSLFIGSNFIFVGIASLAYHATYTLTAAQLDVLGYWSLFALFAALSMARMLNFGLRNGGDELCCSLDGCLGLTCAVECTSGARKRGILLYTLSWFAAVLATDLILWQYIDDVRFVSVEVAYIAAALAGSFVLPIVAIGATRKKEIRSAWGALAAAVLLIGLAAAVLWMDTQPFACTPGSPLQLHALWHAVFALGACFVYIFFRGDVRVPSEMPRRLLHRLSVTSSRSAHTHRSSVRHSASGRFPAAGGSAGSHSSGLGAGDGRHYAPRPPASPRPSSVRSRPSSVHSGTGSVRSGTGSLPAVTSASSVGSGALVRAHSAEPSLVRVRSAESNPSPLARVRSSDAMSTGSRSSTGSRGSGSVSEGSVPRTSSAQRLSAGRVKQSTMPRILESDQEEPVPVAVEAPNPVVNKRLSDLRERQRLLREQQLRLFKERERVKRVGGGPVDDQRSVSSRSSAGGDRRVVARWTCSACGSTENELENERCTCGHWRPPLQSMIPVTRPVAGRNSGYQLS